MSNNIDRRDLLRTTVAGAAESQTRALFGELHLHTGWSMDAYIFNVRTSPDHMIGTVLPKLRETCDRIAKALPG